MTITFAAISQRIELLKTWLTPRVTPEQQAWLDEQAGRVEEAKGGPALVMAIGMAPRKLGKADLGLDADEIAAAVELRPGLEPTDWSVDQAARILFLLASFNRDEVEFVKRLDTLLATAEVGEQIALLRGIPLYPASPLLVARAGEGVRSAMQPVFEAVAHRNPFPREEFNETQWNQMVLKALFIGSKLAPIQGLDERRNKDLAVMLIDYAHERWAAGRAVSPELWRCVGPFAQQSDVDDLARVLHEGTAMEQTAAALALSECSLPNAADALEAVPAVATGIKQGDVSWRDVP